jgi:hypothetical protein
VTLFASTHAAILRLLLALLVGLAALVPGPLRADDFFPDEEPTNSQIRFGCAPSPVEAFIRADPPLPPERLPADDSPPTLATLVVDGELLGQPIAGSGFNMEHALWSCPFFRPALRRRLLEPFMPAIARVDTGLLPLAPEGVPAEELTPQHYRAIMASELYEPSWEFIRRLNRDDVQIMLGVWGGPGAFNDNGHRRGILLEQYADKYVEYVASVVEYLVRTEGLSIWSITVANEPDGGDGTFIPLDLFLEVARKLGPALAPYGVKLYGPDTASAENALDFLPAMLEDPGIMDYMAAVGTHQYYPSFYVERLVETVRSSDYAHLPVVVTEYTGFGFGSMDRGEETHDEVGFMLDIATTLASLHNDGVDAALYWDAVDYYQPGHSAITRWGFLQGPDEAFFPRKRYFGMLQILPYLQPGTQIMSTYLAGETGITPLAIHYPGDGRRDVAIALVNQGGPVQLEVSLHDMPDVEYLEVYLTDADYDHAHLGLVRFRRGHGQVYVPARSIVTLAPTAAPDEEFAFEPEP